MIECQTEAGWLDSLTELFYGATIRYPFPMLSPQLSWHKPEFDDSERGRDFFRTYRSRGSGISIGGELSVSVS